MERKLIYYYECLNREDVKVRLEVHAKDDCLPSWYYGYPAEICTLTDLRLDLQGSQGGPCAPIVKSTLYFSMVDAYDEPGADAEGIIDSPIAPHPYKYGHWEDFYQPDAEAYLVKVLTKSSIEDRFWERWSGYVTPDSYQESLDYRGLVTVTARDGLGRLSDYDFDMPGTYGLISLPDMLAAARAKVNIPMEFKDMGDEEGCPTIRFKDSDGIHEMYRDALMSVAVFEGMNWYDALERALDTMGICIRWGDYNFLDVSSIRVLASFGVTWKDPDDLDHDEATFVGGDRIFDPAYKSIVEKVDYLPEAKVTFDYHHFHEYYGQPGSYGITQNIDFYQDDSGTITGGYTKGTASMPAFFSEWINNGEGWSGYAMPVKDIEISSSILRDEGEGAKNYLFVPANHGGGYSITFSKKVASTDLTATIHLAPMPVYLRNWSGWEIDPMYSTNLLGLQYLISYEYGDQEAKLSRGHWTLSEVDKSEAMSFNYKERTTDISFKVPQCDVLPSGGMLHITLIQFIYKGTSILGIDSRYSKGFSARISGITFENNNSQTLQSNKVTTINNSLYNVTLERKPLFAPLSENMPLLFVENYVGALYYRNAEGALRLWPYNNYWSTQSPDEAVPLPVLIHQQILCYYHAVMEMLEGEYRTTERRRKGEVIPYNGMRFDNIVMYKNRKHILISGTIDWLRCEVTNCSLRGYLDYDELWDTLTPDYE